MLNQETINAMSRKEKATSIRKELKDNGITSRQVAVTSKACLYDDSISLTIKDLNVNHKLVENIVSKYEEVRKCEYSGETLSGCNTYIIVQFDYDTVLKERENYMSKALELKEEGKEYAEGNLLTVAETEEYIILYSPVWVRGNPSFIELCKKESDNKYGGYHYNNIQRRDAYHPESIAEALLMFKCQFGIDVLNINNVSV